MVALVVAESMAVAERVAMETLAARQLEELTAVRAAAAVPEVLGIKVHPLTK